VDERTRDGIVAKLDRADEHLKRLNREIDSWLDGKPHSYWAKPNFHSGSYSIHITVNDEPPLSLSVTCGDYVHCLRSALDHLICGNVKRITKRTAFPMHKDGDDFFCGVVLPARRKQRGPLTGLDPEGELFAMVQGVQPYMGADGYEAHFLHILAELSNADKHKAILTSAAANRLVVDQELWVRAHDVVCSDAEYALGTPLVNGAKVAWGKLTVTGAKPEMEMEHDFPVEVAFGSDLVGLQALGEIRDSVRATITLAFKILGLPPP
jgi:hypothetical protein